MLENKIDDLIILAQRNNDLLQGILSSLGGETPPAAASAKKGAKNGSDESDVQADAAPTVTLDHVRKAFKACAEAKDINTAKAIVAGIVGGDVPNIKHIPQDQLPAVVEALETEGAA